MKEYKLITLGSNNRDATGLLNELAAEGWEVVGNILFRNNRYDVLLERVAQSAQQPKKKQQKIEVEVPDVEIEE